MNQFDDGAAYARATGTARPYAAGPMPELRNPFSSARIVGKNVNPADYFKQDVQRGDPAFVMSRSDLCEFAHCPARWRNGYHRKDSDATEWGTLMDALVLQPHLIVVTDEWKTFRSDAAKAWRDEQAAAGKVPALQCEYEEAQLALAVLMDDPDITQLLEQSDKSVHVEAIYEDAETGLKIRVKCLLDILPFAQSEFGSSIVDFKTAREAFPQIWARSVFDFNYHCQGAVYTDAYHLASGGAAHNESPRDFLHLIQENIAPWQVGKRLLSTEFLTLGRLEITKALRDYCQCLKTGEWPGYERNSRLNWKGFDICDPAPWMITQNV